MCWNSCNFPGKMTTLRKNHNYFVLILHRRSGTSCKDYGAGSANQYISPHMISGVSPWKKYWERELLCFTNMLGWEKNILLCRRCWETCRFAPCPTKITFTTFFNSGRHSGCRFVDTSGGHHLLGALNWWELRWKRQNRNWWRFMWRFCHFMLHPILWILWRSARICSNLDDEIIAVFGDNMCDIFVTLSFTQYNDF